MLDTSALIATLRGAEPFQAAYGVSEAEARQRLSAQWRELDRLARDDPTGYARNLEALAREAGVKLPLGMVQQQRAAAAGGDGGWGSRYLAWCLAGSVGAARGAPNNSKLGVIALSCALHSFPPKLQLPVMFPNAETAAAALGPPTAAASRSCPAGPSQLRGQSMQQRPREVPPPAARRPLIQELPAAGPSAHPEMPAARPGGGPLEQSQQLSHRVAMVRKRQQVTEAGVDPSPPVALRIEVAGFASGLCCGDVAVLLDAEQHTLLVRVEQQRPARAEGTPAVVAATACHRIPLPAGVDVYVVGARARLKSKAGQLVVRLPLL